MIKVLVYPSSIKDACSFYRGLGPWSLIAKQSREVKVEFTMNPNWGEIRSADVFFCLRPASHDIRPAIEAAKDFGTKLWLDFDDDLFKIPADNPTYSIYQNLLPNISEYLLSADVVTVSTDHLKKEWEGKAKWVEVLNNALDPALLRFRPPDIERRNQHVLWRGTATHTRDVASVAKQIVEVGNANPDWSFIFLGSDPAAWECSEKLTRAIRILTPMDCMTFYKAMIAIRPSVLICPLSDSSFNRSKSNIAAIEGTLAGAAVLAPDWPEWKIPGVFRYTSTEDFGKQLSMILKGEYELAPRVQEAWECVSKSLFLEAVNRQRIDILKQLVSA